MTNALLLAQDAGSGPGGALAVIIGIIVVFVAMLTLGFLIMFVKQFKRCPSNRVLVIYGRTGQGQASTTVHGGAAFVWPLIQDYAYLSLEPIQIEVPLRGALSAENIRVNVPSVFTVAVDTKPEVMQNAAVRLLGMAVPELRELGAAIGGGLERVGVAARGLGGVLGWRNGYV